MFALTNFAVKANNAEELRAATLGVAEESGRTDAAAFSANLDGASNGSGSKESGGSEELHLE